MMCAMIHATLLFLALAGARPQDPADVKADDPKAVVFVPDACGAGEGAPPKYSLGKLVFLTDLAQEDPYRATLELLRKAKKPAAVVPYETGKIGAARNELLRLLPEFVIVVTRPERIDVNVHFELLETAASLDADPFVDFAFGYVTGATPEEALAFARRILAVGAKSGALPKTVVEFGPASAGNATFTEWLPHKLAKGFKEMHAFHGPAAEMLAKKDLLSGVGILRAG